MGILSTAIGTPWSMAHSRLGICLSLNPALWWLTVIDVGSHFVVDRIKASPRYLGRFTMKQPFWHWTTFGGDQLIHHLVGIYIPGGSFSKSQFPLFPGVFTPNKSTLISKVRDCVHQMNSFFLWTCLRSFLKSKICI